MKVDIIGLRNYIEMGPRHHFVLALKRKDEKWLLPLRIRIN